MFMQGEGKGQCDAHFGCVARKYKEFLQLKFGRLVGSFAPMADFLNRPKAEGGLDKTTVTELPMAHRAHCSTSEIYPAITDVSVYRQFFAELVDRGEVGSETGLHHASTGAWYRLLGRRLSNIGAPEPLTVKQKSRARKKANELNLDLIQHAMIAAITHFCDARSPKWADVVAKDNTPEMGCGLMGGVQMIKKSEKFKATPWYCLAEVRCDMIRFIGDGYYTGVPQPRIVPKSAPHTLAIQLGKMEIVRTVRAAGPSPSPLDNLDLDGAWYAAYQALIKDTAECPRQSEEEEADAEAEARAEENQQAFDEVEDAEAGEEEEDVCESCGLCCAGGVCAT